MIKRRTPTCDGDCSTSPTGREVALRVWLSARPNSRSAGVSPALKCRKSFQHEGRRLADRTSLAARPVMRTCSRIPAPSADGTSADQLGWQVITYQRPPSRRMVYHWGGVLIVTKLLEVRHSRSRSTEKTAHRDLARKASGRGLGNPARVGETGRHGCLRAMGHAARWADDDGGRGTSRPTWSECLGERSTSRVGQTTLACSPEPASHTALGVGEYLFCHR